MTTSTPEGSTPRPHMRPCWRRFSSAFQAISSARQNLRMIAKAHGNLCCGDLVKNVKLGGSVTSSSILPSTPSFTTRYVEITWLMSVSMVSSEYGLPRSARNKAPRSRDAYSVRQGWPVTFFQTYSLRPVEFLTVQAPDTLSPTPSLVQTCRRRGAGS